MCLTSLISLYSCHSSGILPAGYNSFPRTSEKAKCMAIAEANANSEMIGDMTFCNSIMETIGETPLVRLNSVASDFPCLFLPRSSSSIRADLVKDRIGPAIIEDYERRGVLQPGGTIVEATSGNTGVGLAIAAATKGYRCIFVMPDKMSQEKIQLLACVRGARCRHAHGCGA